MQVTEVRIKLMGNRDDKLQAFCTVTFDNCFVVRDLKVIKGTKGAFVAMPSRKLSDLCHKCGGKNHLRARFCNECGAPLNPDRAARDDKGRSKLHADIAHPIHAGYREEIQRLVLRAYEDELQRAEQPGYQPPSDDFPEIIDDAVAVEEAEEPSPPQPRPPQPRPPTTRPRPPRTFGEGILP